MAAKMGMKLGLGLSGSRLLQQSAGRRLGAGRRSLSVVASVPPEVKSKLRERLPIAVAGASLVATPAAHAAGPAVDAPTVDTAVSSIIDVVKAAGEVVKQGVSAAQTGVDYARSAYDAAAPVVGEVVRTAAPVVEKGVRTAVDVATPVVQSGIKEAGKALTTAAPPVDLSAAKPVFDTTEQAVSSAKPFLEQALTFVTTTEPVLLGQYALGAIAAYYLAPPVLRAAVGLLRGYSGEVTPAAALTAIESEGNAFIVDIRSLRDKESGSPDLPNAGKLIELEYAAIEDRRVRGQLRNPNELEVKVTALQLAALKRLSPATKVLLMDRNGGGAAKAVAKALAARGFSRVFVIRGGFNGWVASKLRTKSSSLAYSRVEVIPGTFAGTASTRAMPGKQLPAPSRNGRTPVTVSNRRALPSSSSASS